VSVCPSLPGDVGLVRDVLASVDCNVQVYAAAGYQALTGPASPLPAALTAMMTIYVAILGYRLLFAVGASRLSDTPVIAIKIGAILALTLNWSVFQTLVFNVVTQAPLQIGRVISLPMAAGGSSLVRDPVDGVQTTYDELVADAGELAKKSAQAAAPGATQPPIAGPSGDEAAAAADLHHAAAALFASTAGVLAAAFIAVGVLTAVGPVFVALFLFEATRGVFAGWLRALVAAMLIPMACWIATSLLLVVLAPRIDLLAQQRAAHQLSLEAASSASAIVFIFAAAQFALVAASLVVASGFRLGRAPQAAAARDDASVREVRLEERDAAEAPSRARALAADLQRSAPPPFRDQLAADVARRGAWESTASVEPRQAAARPARLGETYRRGGALRDARFSQAARP
jgi:type IV secretion system protein VirB6